MAHFDVFNGDADGICALHQLRLAKPMDTTLVTGVKRDIDLLKQVEAEAGDSVTVLDISLEKNRQALLPLLEKGVSVEYFDHHFPGEIPQHPGLQVTIDPAATVCTGLLVNQHLGGAQLPWAVTAAFGDNLFDAARAAAQPLQLDDEQLAQLEELGTLLNYNGYGSSLQDLFFPPAELYRKLSPYSSPFDFIAADPAFTTLREGYSADMQRASQTRAEFSSDDYALFIFPDDPFARRVSGVYSNQLTRQHPQRAHALLCTLPDGGYLISVRAPLAHREGADELCRQFRTGGGRKAAAGVNKLPPSELEQFAAAFRQQFTRS